VTGFAIFAITLPSSFRLARCKQLLPADANFLMVRFDHPQEVFSFLIGKKIIVRDRSKVALCEGYLRITIGSPEENEILIVALKEYEHSIV